VTRLVVNRLLVSLPVLFVVTALTFVLVSFTPGNAAQSILGSGATTEQVQELNQQLGLNDPIWTQYGHWLQGFVQGDLGRSLFTGESVTSMLSGRLGVTLSLVIGTTLVSVVVGVALGLVSALRGGVVGRVVDVFALIGFGLPAFWLALVLVSFFALNLRWFPATGYVDPSDSIVDWVKSLVLPVATLAMGMTPALAKVSRDAILDALNQDFVRVMQANGFSRRSLIYRHVLRNAAIPIVTLAGVLFIAFLGATIFVESVFAMPGLGGASVQAATQHDLPVIQGAVVYFTLIVIAINLVVDLSYGWLDPRVRTR
jgi:peptide/nickel transport system permease protein